jgi:hypothetical protein
VCGSVLGQDTSNYRTVGYHELKKKIIIIIIKKKKREAKNKGREEKKISLYACAL